MNLTFGKVEGMVKKNIPAENETIADDMDLDLLVKEYDQINMYFRDKKSCPYNRGNWVIDLYRIGEHLYPALCLKLPSEMKETDVSIWVKPLTDKLKGNMS